MEADIPQIREMGKGHVEKSHHPVVKYPPIEGFGWVDDSIQPLKSPAAQEAVSKPRVYRDPMSGVTAMDGWQTIVGWEEFAAQQPPPASPESTLSGSPDSTSPADTPAPTVESRAPLSETVSPDPILIAPTSTAPRKVGVFPASQVGLPAVASPPSVDKVPISPTSKAADLRTGGGASFAEPARSLSFSAPARLDSRVGSPQFISQTADSEITIDEGTSDDLDDFELAWENDDAESDGAGKTIEQEITRTTWQVPVGIAMHPSSMDVEGSTDPRRESAYGSDVMRSESEWDVVTDPYNNAGKLLPEEQNEAASSVVWSDAPADSGQESGFSMMWEEELEAPSAGDWQRPAPETLRASAVKSMFDDEELESVGQSPAGSVSFGALEGVSGGSVHPGARVNGSSAYAAPSVLVSGASAEGTTAKQALERMLHGGIDVTPQESFVLAQIDEYALTSEASVLLPYITLSDLHALLEKFAKVHADPRPVLLLLEAYMEERPEDAQAQMMQRYWQAKSPASIPSRATIRSAAAETGVVNKREDKARRFPGARPSAVPSINLDALAHSNVPLTAEEGYILSRIDGMTSVEDILLLLPHQFQPVLTTLLERLWDSGSVSFPR